MKIFPYQFSLFCLQTVGVTSNLPGKVPSELGFELGPQTWSYVGTSLWHSMNKLSTDLPNINDLITDQSVGLLVSADGHLHVYIDGRYVKKVASNLPKQRLWGAVDVHGTCIKIKSEVLSGKLALFKWYIAGNQSSSNAI